MHATSATSERRLFVTGAGGLVGRALVELASREPRRRIDALAREPRPSSANVHAVRGDLLDASSYARCLTPSTTVVHLAARTGKARPAEFERVNVGGTRTLLEACRAAGATRFVHVSTIAVNYPETRHYPYARSKQRAEELVRASDLDHAIVRPTIVVGRGAPAGRSMRMLASKPIVPLFGDGRARVQPIDVDDLASAILELVERDRLGGETLELGGPEVLSFRDLLDRLHRAIAAKPARFARLPLRLLIGATAAVEPVLLPLMPLTAGQLYAFAYDSAAKPNALWDARRRAMKDVETMLRELAADG